MKQLCTYKPTQPISFHTLLANQLYWDHHNQQNSQKFYRSENLPWSTNPAEVIAFHRITHTCYIQSESETIMQLLWCILLRSYITFQWFKIWSKSCWSPYYLPRWVFFFLIHTASSLSSLFLIYSITTVKSKSYRNSLKELNTIISSLERTECNYGAKQSNLG